MAHSDQRSSPTSDPRLHTTVITTLPCGTDGDESIGDKDAGPVSTQTHSNDYLRGEATSQVLPHAESGEHASGEDAHHTPPCTNDNQRVNNEETDPILQCYDRGKHMTDTYHSHPSTGGDEHGCQVMFVSSSDENISVGVPHGWRIATPSQGDIASYQTMLTTVQNIASLATGFNTATSKVGEGDVSFIESESETCDDKDQNLDLNIEDSPATDSEGFFRHGVFIMSRKQLEDALKRGRGVVRTRFPPEPSGPLHIGHAKALHVNFSVAENYNGECILRFDDTNPTTARRDHCNNCMEMIEWLGYKPTKISFTSDYFDVLFQYAIVMITKGKGYVCHLESVNSPIKTKSFMVSPWRNRSIKDNLREFYKMREGGYVDGQAVLKMKVSTRSGIIDPVAYRIVSREHYRTGARWSVYPTYDFSHPIVDSLEAIAVSLCTFEFVGRRPLYDWVQNILNLPRVCQREQRRLEIPFTITSKRQLNNLVGKFFDDFDDPRLVTLAGLRRRGIPPSAIRKFVSAGKHEYNQLLDITRKVLLPVCPHRQVVLQPLLCNVVNYDELTAAANENPLVARVREFGYDLHKTSRDVYITRQIYINTFDFNEDDEASRYCLTPSSSVHLYSTDYVMRVMRLNYSHDKVIELDVVLDKVLVKNRQMKVLTWVCNPVQIKVNLIEYKFLEPKNEPVPIKSATALAEPSLVSEVNIGSNFTYGQTYQAERFAFITLDPSSVPNDYIFNITCFLHIHDNLQKSVLNVFQ
nr:glutamine--tRNA ligase-like [Procambarus clarkii]